MTLVHLIAKLSFSLVLAALLSACAGAPPLPEYVTRDHWETASDRRYVYAQRCGTGPFELRFPAREVEWGRRLTVEVYSNARRSLPLQYQVGSGNGRFAYSNGIREQGTHPRCRIAGAVTPVQAGSESSGGSAVVAVPVVPGVLDTADAEPAETPQLTPFDGELPAYQTTTVGFAFFPRGVPRRRGDLIDTRLWESEDAGGEFVVRFWLEAPSDFDGLVLRIRDQELRPDEPADQYRERFAISVGEGDRAARAAAARRRSSARTQRGFCDLHPAAPYCNRRFHVRPTEPPPPPLEEQAPSPPSSEVEWVGGYWRFDQTAVDYAWVPGTFVSRTPPPVASAASAAPPIPAAMVVVAPAPVEIDASVAPPPPPRSAEIPPPPAGSGLVWVGGHWRLEASRWVWVSGAWAHPPSRYARPFAPAIRMRAGVRVYVPGGWLEVP